MVLITSGKNWKGEACELYLDGTLLKNLEGIKKIVHSKDFDYVSIISGLPGVGKSNFSITLARYFCEWFDENYIAFSADEFITLTNNCPQHSAVVLDESFASLNSKVGMSADFLKIINHLQLIRQRNLFIFLNLPNFFDLSKSIAIYRSSHLFVCYGEEFGDRGRFAAFGREEKKKLYILGQKFMNYQAVTPNFRGRFTRQKVIDEEKYIQLKLLHLQQQETLSEKIRVTKSQVHRDRLIAYCHLAKKLNHEELIKITTLNSASIYFAINRQKENILREYPKLKEPGPGETQ